MEYWIADIEGEIDKDLKTDTICLGLDVAEYNTGVCLLRTDKEKLYIDYLGKIIVSKGRKKETIFNKIDEFEKQTKKIIKELNLKKKKENKILVIEDCWYNPSRGVGVLKTLARFETLAYQIFKKEFDKVLPFIQARSARTKIKFKKDKNSALSIKEQIQEYLEIKFDIIIEDDDIADAFVLALAGLIK